MFETRKLYIIILLDDIVCTKYSIVDVIICAMIAQKIQYHIYIKNLDRSKQTWRNRVYVGQLIIEVCSKGFKSYLEPV